MKRTIKMLSTAVAVLLVGAVLSTAAARTLDKMPSLDPKPVYMEALLSPVLGDAVYGRATYQTKAMGDHYTFYTELLVPTALFKEYGIDPADGFDNETVTVLVGKTGFKMTFTANEPEGALFTVTEFGTGWILNPGDEVRVDVNEKEAANGKF